MRLSLVFLLLCNTLTYPMERLQTDLTELQKSLSGLERDLNLLSQPQQPKAQWSIAPDKLAPVIDQLAENIEKIIKQKYGTLLGSILTAFEKKDSHEFLRNTIGTLVNVQSSNLQDSFKPQSSQPIDELKSLVKSLLYDYFLMKWTTTKLDLCTCTPIGLRLTLIIEILNETKKLYPNKTQPLVYTSLGSGGLLQDYLTLKQLIEAGYKDIKVNLIDLTYPEVIEEYIDPERIKDESEAEYTHLDFIKEHPTFEPFEQQLKKIARANNSSIIISTYNTAEWYKYQAQETEPEKSNILVMVDPDVIIRYYELLKAFPSEASILGIKIGATEEPAFYLFVPRQGKPQLFANEKQSSQHNFETLKKGLINLIKDTGQITVGPETVKHTYSANLINKVINKKSDLKINEIIFYSDPYITFQDLVVNTLAKNPIVYALYWKNNPSKTQGPPLLEKINPNEYRNVDVITPGTGSYLTQQKVGFTRVYP